MNKAIVPVNKAIQTGTNEETNRNKSEHTNINKQANTNRIEQTNDANRKE